MCTCSRRWLCSPCSSLDKRSLVVSSHIGTTKARWCWKPSSGASQELSGLDCRYVVSLVTYFLATTSSSDRISVQCYVLIQMTKAMHSLPGTDEYIITDREHLYRSVNPQQTTVAGRASDGHRMYSPALKRARKDIRTQENNTKRVLDARRAMLQGPTEPVTLPRV